MKATVEGRRGLFQSSGGRELEVGPRTTLSLMSGFGRCSVAMEEGTAEKSTQVARPLTKDCPPESGCGRLAAAEPQAC